MANLPELQERIRQIRVQRGFTTEPLRLLALLIEEVGEVARELKKSWSPNYSDFRSEQLAEELADVFVLVSSLATAFDIDLSDAVDAKFVRKDGARRWMSAEMSADPGPDTSL